MTLPPFDSDDVHGVEGPDYKVGPSCANPKCEHLADHAHHIWRASKVANAPRNAWVAVDGFVVGNKTGLCWRCHNDVTGEGGGHKAAIRWIQGDFWWCLVSGEKPNLHYHPVAWIQPQPPTPAQLATDDPRASDTGSPESCPFCGQERKRRSAPTRVGRRKRKRWTVLVPDEEIENGADVLDSLISNLAPLVPNADNTSSGRYYVLVQALAYSMISGEDFVASFEGRHAA